MAKPLRVLIVEDSEDDAQLILQQFRKGGYEPTFERVEVAEAMEAALNRQKWDVILCDYVMPHFNALAALSLFQKKGLDLPFIIISGKIGEDMAVEVIKAGATDYLMKDNLTRFIPAIEHGLKEAETERERKQMEKALLQSEKLKAVGEMASGIAHDFNNVLTIIKGNVQLLEMYCEGHGKTMDGLRVIKEAANDGAETVRRMLNFAGKEMGLPQFEPVNIRESVKQALDFTRPRWEYISQAKGITYDINLKGLQQVPDIPSSSAELKEVLVNIINNALDAMPKGGRLSFCSTWKRKEDIVLLSISDNGVGMSKDMQIKIFDLFFTTKGPEGSGLGMSVAYGIITRLGGKIDIESRKGKGTTITLVLPTLQNTSA